MYFLNNFNFLRPNTEIFKQLETDSLFSATFVSYISHMCIWHMSYKPQHSSLSHNTYGEFHSTLIIHKILQTSITHTQLDAPVDMFGLTSSKLMNLGACLLMYFI